MIQIVGADSKVELIGQQPGRARFHFYRGADPEAWISGARGYRHLVYRNIYPHIDKEEIERQLAARRIDVVSIGVRPSEQEHEFSGQNTQTGPHLGRRWRHAANGGFFGYTLAVSPDQPTTLRCTYWGSDSGPRTFDILVDERKIATQTLDRDKPDEFFDVQYKLPVDLTRGKSKVTVKFQAHPGKTAGGLFGVSTLLGH